MNMKKLSVGILIAFAFVCSLIAGYFTIKHYNVASKDNAIVNTSNNSKDPSMKLPVATAVNINDKTVISEKTKIIKKYNYTLGTPTTKEIVEYAGPDVLGMDRKSANEYYKKQQFLIVDFNSKNVILFKDINSWPPNSYVIKGDKGLLNIYYTNAKGELVLLKRGNHTLDSLPDTDKQELEKGKTFDKLEDIESMFDELDS